MFDYIYKHFSKFYFIPKEIIRLDIKRYLSNNYSFSECQFNKKFNITHIIKYTFIYYGFFLASILRSKKSLNPPKKYDLIIEWVASNIELKRFERLIDYFKKENVLVVTVNKLEESDYNLIYRPKGKYFDFKEITRISLIEIFFGYFVFLWLSIILRTNLFPIVLNLVWQYIYYFSIFNNYKSKYCIQERHYQTSAIKNYLFKHFKGKYSTTIQKNIIPRGHSSSYYSSDVFFYLGNKTAERAIEQGSALDKVVATGSLFSEYYWFGNNYKNGTLEKKYDIINIGGNALGVIGGPFDINDNHIKNYYEHFEWLANLSKENPQLNIGIIHHGGEPADEKEMEIIGNTNIVRIDTAINSYKIAFQSKCVVTFASTMGYELLAHGLPTFFLDPKGENSQFLPENSLLDKWRITNYNNFKNTINSLLSREGNYENPKMDLNDLCLNSEKTSKNIYKWLINN